MKAKKGWEFPSNSRKAHYFIDSRSLCGKWMFLGDLEDFNDESADNCTSCKKAVQKIRANEALKQLQEKKKIAF